MTPVERDELVTAACQARQQAYAKYSQYQVGAAIRTRSGKVFQGCNVENRSYGLTICAERAAVFAAVAEGHREIIAVAVATLDGDSPCGACRQVLAEFAADIPVLIVADQQPPQVREVGLQTLLPDGFNAKQTPMG